MIINIKSRLNWFSIINRYLYIAIRKTIIPKVILCKEIYKRLNHSKKTVFESSNYL